MHRIDTSTALKDKFGAGKNGFTRGNPQTGTPATDLDDDYFDMLQEELVGIIEAAGITLDKAKHDQLRTALPLFLELKSASKRDVGTGANQIPDMSSFASVKSVTGSQRLPGGLIRQWQQVTLSSGGTCTFPTAYPTALLNFSVIHGPGATGPILASVATANRSGLQILHNGATNIFTVVTEGY